MGLAAHARLGGLYLPNARPPTRKAALTRTALRPHFVRARVTSLSRLSQLSGLILRRRSPARRVGADDTRVSLLPARGAPTRKAALTRTALRPTERARAISLARLSRLCTLILPIPPLPPRDAYPRMALPKSSARRRTIHSRRVVQRRVLVRGPRLAACEEDENVLRAWPAVSSVGSSKSGGAASLRQRDRPPVTPGNALRRCSLARRAFG
jgi:hypothetical protein